MFASVPSAPPDPILGLSEAFAADDRPGKLNLTVGVYCTAEGTTPVLDVVRDAERRLAETETTKTYLPIAGSPAFAEGVSHLLFGERSDLARRAVVADTPGGTGALSVVARLAWVTEHTTTVWIPNPTWPNHRAVFSDAGLGVQTYRYADPSGRRRPLEELLADLGRTTPGDLVVLHACCHNPTGVDLSVEEVGAVAAVLADRGAVAVVDAAYVGLGDGVEPDTAGIRLLADAGVDTFVCLSFSKSLGLYAERVGALVTVASDADTAADVQSRIKACARSLYSNPPKHGGETAAIVLTDPGLRDAWLVELEAMRSRINAIRAELADALERAESPFCPGVGDGRGLFCLSGASADQVETLRRGPAVVLVGGGRVDVAAPKTRTGSPPPGGPPPPCGGGGPRGRARARAGAGPRGLSAGGRCGPRRHRGARRGPRTWHVAGCVPLGPVPDARADGRHHRLVVARSPRRAAPRRIGDQPIARPVLSPVSHHGGRRLRRRGGGVRGSGPPGPLDHP